MNQTVQFVQMEPVLHHSYFRDKYELRRDRKFVWLQRVLFWLLRKIGAYAYDTTVTYKRVVVDPRKFVEKLVAQRSYITAYFNKRPEHLLIGAEDYRELMGEMTEITNPLSFDTVMGLKVTVIPWMRGVLVVPKF